jgi:hypothetical protein
MRSKNGYQYFAIYFDEKLFWFFLHFQISLALVTRMKLGFKATALVAVSSPILIVYMIFSSMPIGFMRHSSSFLMETSDPTIEAEVELPPITRKPTS